MAKTKLHLDADVSFTALEKALKERGHDVTRTPCAWMPFDASVRTQLLAEIPAATSQSQAMSKALKKRGFTFVGQTIVYAFMQAVGMVNDHVNTCFRYEEVAGLSNP